MDSLAQYIIALSSAAIVSGIMLAVVRESGYESLIKLICGIFMTITAVAPLCDISMPELESIYVSQSDGAEAAIEYGKIIAEETRNDIIRNELEAYILDKTKAMGVSLDVSIILSQGIPSGVRLNGTLSHDQKNRMSQLIMEELGIPKEKQQWIGSE